MRRLFGALDATWPAHSYYQEPPWRLCYGAGGGQRVSAAIAEAPGQPVTSADIDRAESRMRALDQVPLFMIREGEADLDAALGERGYGVVDPVAILAAPASSMKPGGATGCSVVPCDTPLAVMEEIWSEGGIDRGRLDVMARAKAPKAYLLLRCNDRVAAVVFVACDGDVAMLHALEVRESHRRKGYGRHLSIAAAGWAADHGARTLALLAVRSNAAAIGLYQGLGMTEVAHYHYRKKQAGRTGGE